MNDERQAEVEAALALLDELTAEHGQQDALAVVRDALGEAREDVRDWLAQHATIDTAHLLPLFEAEFARSATGEQTDQKNK